MSSEPLSKAAIPSQSPAAGEPEPVDPPTELSLIEVKVIGLAAVPMASRVPWTAIAQGTLKVQLERPPSPLITAPGAIVRVLPSGIFSGLSLVAVGTRVVPTPQAADCAGRVESAPRV